MLITNMWAYWRKLSPQSVQRSNTTTLWSHLSSTHTTGDLWGCEGIKRWTGTYMYYSATINIYTYMYIPHTLHTYPGGTVSPTLYAVSLTTPTRDDFNWLLQSDGLLLSFKLYDKRTTPFRILSPGATFHDVTLAWEVEDIIKEWMGRSLVEGSKFIVHFF